MAAIDKYMPTQGGIAGLFNRGTTAMGNFWTGLGDLPKRATDKADEWGDVLIYGGVIAIGAVLILLAYSFVNGKQNLGQVVQGGAALAKMA
jgi:hypothetical protein